jgi:hypothetical protein
MKLVSTIGIEFSYVLPDELSPNWCIEEDMADTYSRALNLHLRKVSKLMKLKVPYNCGRAHNDQGAIEVSSPVFENIQQLTQYFNELQDITKKFRLKTHRESSGGGGGHIHLKVPKYLKKHDEMLFVINIMRDLANRPYLNYFFNEPCDDHTSNTMSSILSQNRSSEFNFQFTDCDKMSDVILNPNIEDSNAFEKIWLQYFEKFIPYAQKNYSSFWADKAISHPYNMIYKNNFFDYRELSAIYNLEYRTIEFRFFDMPKNESQLLNMWPL